MISYRRNVLDIHDSGEKVLTEKASKDYQVNTSLSHQANGRVSAGQAVGSGGRGQPTASGSGRCLPDTSSRGSEDAVDGRRVERSIAE